MDLLQTIAATVVVLGVLVTFHEFGHFWVARRCGVKVLRFSVGFGKVLYSRYDKHGTEFVIAALPLGGYVKMLDEREAEVDPSERHLAFNTKTVAQRMAIVAAGPIANFLLAIAAFWLMFVLGIQTIVPVVGEIEEGSIAERAGLSSGYEITALDGQPVQSWDEISLGLMARVGDTAELEMQARLHEVSGHASQQTQSFHLPIESFLSGVDEPRPLSALGLSLYRPQLEPVLGRIVEGGRAEKAGLLTGDKLIGADGVALGDWTSWVELVRASAEIDLSIELERDGQLMTLPLRPALHQEGEQSYGYIGAGVAPFEWPESVKRTISYGPLAAITPALQRTWTLSTLTGESIIKMFKGIVSVKNLSGPITIAKVAGASAKSGLESFLNFLAILSISLGVLNLLPIPVLDGGHLLFYALEWVKGSPVSERVQQVSFQIGISLIGVLMMLALYNDFSRL